MNKKNTFIFFTISCLILFSGNASAQGGNKFRNLVRHDYNRYHFGFILSLNQMDFSLKVNEDLIGYPLANDDIYELSDADYSRLMSMNSVPMPGFTVGIISNLKLAPLFDLRFIPSLAFGERKLNYSFIKVKNNESVSIDIGKSIRSTHIDLPCYLKFKSKRANNFRAYVMSGLKFTYDLAANSKKNKENNQDLLRLKKQDLLFESGVGFEFYMVYFKFSVELKMSYGFVNLIDSTDNIFANGITSIKSKLFQISFNFE
ncbi:MAG: PorT family protein [Bacteroidetes bacterium]|nr:PorT family protein [Bacteroidota bacterium]